MINIQFEFEHEIGTFRDTLVLPDDHIFTEQEIKNLKIQRFENWKQSLVEQSQKDQ